MHETTSLGAAIAAGFAIGVWKEFDELKNINREHRKIFQPRISQIERSAMFDLWTKAVSMCKGWVNAAEKERKETLEEEQTREGFDKSSEPLV
jgi:glycerol kinase